MRKDEERLENAPAGLSDCPGYSFDDVKVL
jgi:hypothetical protein